MGKEDRKSSKKSSRSHRSRSRDRDLDDDSDHSHHSRPKHHSSSKESSSDRKKRSDHHRRSGEKEHQEDKAREKSSSAGGTSVDATSSSKKSLGSSEHDRRERLLRQSEKEQEIKAREKASSAGGTAVGAKKSLGSTSSEHERRERLARQSTQEQEAKRRAKGSSKTGSTAVGAFSETSKEPDVAERKRLRQGITSPAEGSKNRQQGSSISKQYLSNAGNHRVGAYGSTSSEYTSKADSSNSNIRPGVFANRSRPSDEKAAAMSQQLQQSHQSHSRSLPPPPPIASSAATSNNTMTADVAHDDNVMPVEAKPVQDTDDEDRDRLLNLEIQNGEIRMQMQRVFDKQEEEENERREQVSMARKHRNKIIAAVVVVIIVGGVIGYIFSRPTEGPDITVVAVTDSPTTSPPTESPSSPPSAYSYPKPSASDCTAIRTQSGISGQETMATQSYGITFDVELTSEELLTSDWYEQLLIGLRNRFVPNLACCEDSASRRYLSPPRRLNEIRCVVANAEVSSTTQDTWTSCGTACRQVSANLKLYLKGDEGQRAILFLIDEVITGYETISALVELDLNPAVFKSVAPGYVIL